MLPLTTRVDSELTVMEALRQFCELLPVVKSEFDSFENEVDKFETLSADSTAIEQVNLTFRELEPLEVGVRDILDVDNVCDFALFIDLTNPNLHRLLHCISQMYWRAYLSRLAISL